METVVICDQQIAGIQGYNDICSVCALEIFVAHSTVRAAEAKGLTKKDLTLYCLECGIPIAMKCKDTMPLSEEQLKEIKEGLKKVGL